ncbi:MAG TPA: hypothetical protein DIV82_03740 [Brevundimonas diminuta]|nr:hypothetical protein [Brevundimonas diminuta]
MTPDVLETPPAGGAAVRRSPGPCPDVASLDDDRLLGLLLRPVSGDTDRLAAALLERFGSLGGVVSADAGELRRVLARKPDGLVLLDLAREFAIRLAREGARRRTNITSWTELRAYVRTMMAHRPREQFRVLFLDNRNRLMTDEMIAEGTVDHAPVYPREVVRRALELSASALVLVHNHPSGDPTPSRADIEMTTKVVEAARCLGLQVHDHLIVARDGTASFRALGLM